jgi:YfiR/HmsC-like
MHSTIPSRIPLRSRLLACLALAALFPAHSASSAEPEDELRAAVVLSFLRYGEWSPALPANAPLTVGLLGRAAFADVLRHSLEGKTVNEHAIHILELKSASELHGCQIVYFAEDKVFDTQAALENPALARVLTIGETRDFLDWGGAVHLFVLDGHIAFEVSIKALEREGISISSRLLRFGQIRNPKKGDRL